MLTNIYIKLFLSSYKKMVIVIQRRTGWLIRTKNVCVPFERGSSDVLAIILPIKRKKILTTYK